jgi:hypothetical protein
MIDYPNKFEPGDVVSASGVSANFAAIEAATALISDKDIDIGSIDHRHLAGAFKTVQTDIGAGPAAAPLGAGALSTIVGTIPDGYPYLVFASLSFEASGGDASAKFGIYEDLGAGPVQRTFVRISVQNGSAQTLNLFWFSGAATDPHPTITLRYDTTYISAPPANANFSVNYPRLMLIGIRG